MKMVFVAGVIFCIALLPLPITAQNTVTAKVTHLVGTVEVRSKTAASWRPARLGMTVKEKGDIRVFVESEAEVTFTDGTKLKIGENSVVTLSRMKTESGGESSQSTVKILSGKVWGNVKKLTSSRSEFDFETPTAVASIRGTRLGIEVGKRRTTVDVYEGKVFVRRKSGRGSAMVTNNNRAIVEQGKKEVKVLDFKTIRETIDTRNGSMEPVDPFVASSQQSDSSAVPQDTAGQQPSDTAGAESGATDEDATGQGTEIPDSSGTGQGAESEGESGSAETESVDARLLLTVATPAKGTKITEPLIIATGKTTPGAKVFVNEMQVSVGRDGTFNGRIPLPDEPYTYTVVIRAELDGKEVVLQRQVTYEPKTGKLFLECSSPADGRKITSRSIRISGKTLPRATVSANGIPLSVATNGVFSGELPLTEQMIGEYQLEIIARNDDDELNRMMNLEISGESPQINISAPVCLFSLQGQQATLQRTVPLQLLDRTPGDELTLTYINNGSVEKISSEPGRTENVLLNEGMNEYSFQVTDRAGNTSPVFRGKLYYLPGPIILLLNEPSRNPMVYEGVPPVLHPGRTVAEEPVDVEVEIDDGIGTVPLSIKYCRVTGNGQTIQLRNNNDYIYTGSVNVRRGTNQFTVQVEDLTGRLEQLRFSVIVK
ncbi:MAG: FecR domain-containing protein [Chitinispirillaceae bacterium]|nr:FecR domain-containing protein [Chitinispirillaceae bacterium]